MSRGRRRRLSQRFLASGEDSLVEDVLLLPAVNEATSASITPAQDTFYSPSHLDNVYIHHHHAQCVAVEQIQTPCMHAGPMKSQQVFFHLIPIFQGGEVPVKPLPLIFIV
jgi:hypothetical protein